MDRACSVNHTFMTFMFFFILFWLVLTGARFACVFILHSKCYIICNAYLRPFISYDVPICHQQLIERGNNYHANTVSTIYSIAIRTLKKPSYAIASHSCLSKFTPKWCAPRYFAKAVCFIVSIWWSQCDCLSALAFVLLYIDFIVVKVILNLIQTWLESILSEQEGTLHTKA